MLTIALAKGRLAERTAELFQLTGYDTSELGDSSRKLVFDVPEGDVRFLLVKPQDVPVYVYHGVSDLGVAGKDTLLEAGLPMYEMLDLGFGRCRICVAGYPDTPLHLSRPLRVATKYPRITRRYFEQEGADVDIIELHGSIELAPVVGLADVIVDIVESGSTLRENGLTVLREVMSVSARLVVNRVSLKAMRSEIRPLIEQLGAMLET